MQHLLINKMILSTISTLIFIGLFAISAPNVQADVTHYHHGEYENIITFHKDNTNNVYHINGKTFYWRDLTPEQQSQLLIAQKNMQKIQQEFQIEEEKLNALAMKMQEKALVIENEVNKLERVSVKFDKKEINMHDISNLAAELAKLSSINEQLVQQQQLEMQYIEEEMAAVDLSLVSDLEIFAKELEQVLVEIAQSR